MDRHTSDEPTVPGLNLNTGNERNPIKRGILGRPEKCLSFERLQLFVFLACHKPVLEVIQPLFTVLSSGDNKSDETSEKNSWERRELNPGLLSNKQRCYLRAIAQKIS